MAACIAATVFLIFAGLRCALELVLRWRREVLAGERPMLSGRREARMLLMLLVELRRHLEWLVLALRSGLLLHKVWRKVRKLWTHSLWLLVHLGSALLRLLVGTRMQLKWSLWKWWRKAVWSVKWRRRRHVWLAIRLSEGHHELSMLRCRAHSICRLRELALLRWSLLMRLRMRMLVRMRIILRLRL